MEHVFLTLLAGVLAGQSFLLGLFLLRLHTQLQRMEETLDRIARRTMPKDRDGGSGKESQTAPEDTTSGGRAISPTEEAELHGLEDDGML